MDWEQGRAGLPAHAGLVDQAFDTPDSVANDFGTGSDISESSAMMATAWDEDDALAAELAEEPADITPEASAESESPAHYGPLQPADGNPLQTVDPFEADDRFAQLPNDPFDEPAGDVIPELDRNQNLEEIENALQRELERREADIRERAGETEAPTSEEELSSLPDDTTERSQIGDPAPRSELDFHLQIPERRPVETVEPLPRGFEERLSEEAAQSRESCEEELAALRSDRISTVDLNIRVDGVPGEDFPYECQLGEETLKPRVWSEITYTWKASALCHKPLYFEDVQLERYGHSWPRCAQPLVSGAHFFGSAAILPYKMGLKTPNECVYALGHYRPGSCAPYYIEALPFTWRAAAFQAGAVTGIHFALP